LLLSSLPCFSASLDFSGLQTYEPSKNLTGCFFVFDSMARPLENHMTATNHYRGQIQRATERLAHLQARELLANRRREAKAQETAKRDEMKRRHRVADLVFLAGANNLDDPELLGALLDHIAIRENQEIRAIVRLKGVERLSG
jgi:hypothetical protein